MLLHESLREILVLALKFFNWLVLTNLDLYPDPTLPESLDLDLQHWLWD